MRQTQFNQLIDQFVSDLERSSDAVEGIVSASSGPPIYRRVDCDGRALAYIRARPRKKLVRVDVSGLWHAPRQRPSCQPMAAGVVSLILRSDRDIPEAIRYLKETIELTRKKQ